MQPVTARVPVRIDLAGGTLDIWPVNLALGRPAVTVNAALGLEIRAAVTPRPEGGIHLASRDLGLRETHADRAALAAALRAGACRLPLLGLAVLAAPGGDALALETHAALPAGSGLGGSSAMLGAVLGALHAAAGVAIDPRDLQPLAQDVETALLGTPTGYQDYFPPLLGGCLALTRTIGDLAVESLPVDLEALGSRLRLAYTGEPHESGLTNWGVVRAFVEQETRTTEALAAIAAHATAVRDGLRAGDLDAAFAAMLADGQARRAMAPGVSTPTIEALDGAMRAAGALGTKICGAGGGGCVLILLPEPGVGPTVDRALAAGRWEPMPVALVAHGLRIERADG